MFLRGADHDSAGKCHAAPTCGTSQHDVCRVGLGWASGGQPTAAGCREDEGVGLASEERQVMGVIERGGVGTPGPQVDAHRRMQSLGGRPFVVDDDSHLRDTQQLAWRKGPVRGSLALDATVRDELDDAAVGGSAS